ncbi:SDR family NAD(P)-dependent oxidoreductase [Streptomyces sp. DSM 116496]|uniref:SDR family NAD(P)-dependent oxidoreductase n=1 Tax=Streptomyces stoeckheimensis TaxID=3344656 RepID=UPI0038B36CB7
MACPGGLLVGELRTRGRPVSAAVLNVGIGRAGAFLDTDPEDSAKAIDVNVSSTVHLARCLLPGMVGRGEGRVLITSPVAAELPCPYNAVCNASKASCCPSPAPCVRSCGHRRHGYRTCARRDGHAVLRPGGHAGHPCRALQDGRPRARSARGVPGPHGRQAPEDGRLLAHQGRGTAHSRFSGGEGRSALLLGTSSR